MNTSSHGSSSRTSSRPAHSSLRPRASRLISGLDEGDDVSFDPTKAPTKRIASPAPNPLDSRSASPIPSKHPSRSASAFGARRPDRFVDHIGSGSPKLNGNGSTASLTSLWGSSWTTIQGIASDLLGNEVTSGASSPSHSRKSSKSYAKRPTSSARAPSWGPKPGVPLPSTSSVATGTREERETLVRAQKRKDLLLGTASQHPDALGRFKRRTSDELASTSAPPGANEDRDALVYIHTVKPADTLAGITIKYNCSAQVLRKANRMWPNDSVQTKQTLVLPIDACGVKGRLIDAPEDVDLLSGISEDTSVGVIDNTELVHGTLSTDRRARNESISTQGDRPGSSVLSSIADSEPPWTHDSWVMLPNASVPTEIARLSRRTLGYFPPARRKSQSYSDLDTPSTSLDLNRGAFLDPGTLSPSRHDAPQRPRRGRTLSNASNGYFPSYLTGPGGVGTMNKNVRGPGPAQDGLNKHFAKHLPNVAPPVNQQHLYMPDVPLYSDDPSRATTPLASGAQTPSNINLEQMGASVETWIRKMATKAQSAMEAAERRDPARSSVGVSGTGRGGIGDLIEMADSFSIGDDDDEEEGRGRKASIVEPSIGPSTHSGASYGHDRLRGRGISGTSAASAKRAKDD